MSIYIKGLEMPQTCRECPLEQPNDSYNCAINGKSYSWGLTHRPHDCPLAKVPPHGRLIDADAMAAKDNEDFRAASFALSSLADQLSIGMAHEAMQKAIAEASTIIPADPAEEDTHED